MYRSCLTIKKVTSIRAILLVQLGCGLLATPARSGDQIVVWRPTAIPSVNSRIDVLEQAGKRARYLDRAEQAAGVVVEHADAGVKRAGADKSIYGAADFYETFKIVNEKPRNNSLGVATISKWDRRSLVFQGECNAFLVSDDIVATASHCIDANIARVSAIRFNDRFVSPAQVGTLTVFEPAEVVFWNHEYDIALVRLRADDRGSPPSAQFPKLSLSRRELDEKDKIYLIGNPGKEQQYYGDCSVVREHYVRPNGKHAVGVDCDAFGGNSGSPIFDARTDLVIGVFWGGQTGDKTFEAGATATEHEFVVPIAELARALEKGLPGAGVWPKEVPFAPR